MCLITIIIIIIIIVTITIFINNNINNNSYYMPKSGPVTSSNDFIKWLLLV